MRPAIPDILSRIVEAKRAGVEAVRRRREELDRLAERRAAERRNLHAALAARDPALIAEIKRASPSKGTLAEAVDPVKVARGYEEGGAAALSVLTDEEFFRGSLADLEAARAAVKLPVLRKDFTLDEVHVIEAAASGADAILLIAAILDARQLRRLREAAACYGMAALVEVHEKEELGLALDSGAEIIGVNNRNLHTFEVSLETSLRLAEKIPPGVIRVSESGIHSRADIERLRAAGYQAFLVGEHLMRAPNPTEALRALIG